MSKTGSVHDRGEDRRGCHGRNRAVSGTGDPDDPGSGDERPACQDDGTAGGGVATFSTTLVLHDSAGVATTNFVFGEAIRFDLEARNLSNQVVTLNFPDGQIYDFVVLDASTGVPQAIASTAGRPNPS